MIRFRCPKCGEETYLVWPDISKICRCRCLCCGVVLVFMAATEEDLLRKAFKRKEKENGKTEKTKG